MITARKLGSSPLSLDWSALADVPPALSASSLKHQPDGAQLSEVWKKLQSRLSPSDVGFFDTPADDNLSQLEACVKRAEACRSFEDILVLGIGGSALGPVSLLEALDFRCQGPRFHFLENPDPFVWNTTLAKLKPETTLVLPITKSGGTFETISQLQLALEWLGEDRWSSHVVALTDPEKGDLRAFAREFDIPTLDIHPSIGGRFSIFSPVGLFPAALAGLDVKAFMGGARKVRDYTLKNDPEKNPLFVLASHLLAHTEQRSVHTIMPYSTQLRSLGLWWVQMWGESLGKDGKGYTPVAAVGATDQHSLLQLLRDGPNDKITLFLKIEGVEDPVGIPSNPKLSKLKAFSLLQGHSLQELLDVEWAAVNRVLTNNQRPHATFGLSKLDEETMGALYFGLSLLTAYMGTLMGVNPFDQPGVEEGKVYIKESLSKGAGGHDEDEDPNSPYNRLRGTQG